jgi:hypothetical protein
MEWVKDVGQATTPSQLLYQVKVDNLKRQLSSKTAI